MTRRKEQRERIKHNRGRRFMKLWGGLREPQWSQLLSRAVKVNCGCCANRGLWDDSGCTACSDEGFRYSRDPFLLQELGLFTEDEAAE